LQSANESIFEINLQVEIVNANTLPVMEAIKRIIPRNKFKLYNIPDNFGEQAEMIIIPVKDEDDGNKISSYDLMKLQEKSGMTQMLNEPEEDYWNAL
jgi:hypothetical protein